MLSKWGQRFSPLSLFAAGEQGGWWDPSDFGTMFQDSAGTTPVTAVGQPVGLIRDKSGRGNHRTQGTAASRPVLTQDATGLYLLYDGVDDFMQTVSVDFSATDKITVWAGARKQSDTTSGMCLEFSANSSSGAGTFALIAPYAAATGNYGWRSRGTASSDAVSGSSFASPNSAVLCAQGDIAADLSTLRANGTQVGTSAVDQGTGNYGNAVIYSGMRAGTTLPFNGREYQTIIRGAASSAAQVSLAERFVGSKMGIVL